MKNNIKELLQKLVADRYLLILLSLSLILAIIFSVIIGLSVHQSDLQLVSHYSAYGITHLYRDQWYYLYLFSFFELVVCFMHSVISVKLLVVKSREFALAFAWLGIFMLIVGLILAQSVINVWTPL